MNAIATVDNRIRTIFTSHSIDNTFESCARKFEFLNFFDKRPPRDSGYAADIGTALHDGTQAWLVARQEGKDPLECEAIGFIAMMLKFPWALESKQKQQVRSFDNVVNMLYAIIRHSMWDGWELVKIDDRWAVEVPFVIHHTSIGTFNFKATGETCQFATQGKIDFILRHIASGRIACWDLKTTTLDANLVRSEYTWSGQQTGYGQVVQTLIDSNLNHFEINYLVARFSANDPPDVEVVPLTKDEDDVDDYWLAKIDRLNRMKHYAETGWFPRRNGGCNSYQHECTMFNICPSRETDTILAWFQSIGAVPQEGYEPWVTLEL